MSDLHARIFFNQSHVTLLISPLINFTCWKLFPMQVSTSYHLRKLKRWEVSTFPAETWFNESNLGVKHCVSIETNDFKFVGAKKLFYSFECFVPGPKFHREFRRYLKFWLTTGSVKLKPNILGIWSQCVHIFPLMVLLLNRKICPTEEWDFFCVIQAQAESSENLFSALERLQWHTFPAPERFRLTIAESF